MKTILIAGAAGAGLNSSQTFIEKGLRSLQYHLLSYRNYMSRVRGGFNYTFISFDASPLHHTSDKADIAILHHASDYERIAPYLTSEAVLIAPQSIDCDEQHTLHVLSAERIKALSSHKNAFGIAAIGLIFGLLDAAEDVFSQFVNSKWTSQINDTNHRLLQLGYTQVQAKDQHPIQKATDTMLINGNQATALGALAAGVGFYSAYPMAPSTGIMNYLGTHEREAQIIVEQAEDEISAIMSTLGASACGVRAMTGTSGGGFCLMVEGIGYAAVSETPIVIANVMRPGPATGLPTRTEQADLLFAVTASQGEFARIVLAPRTIEDCFYTTFRAFNLADKYQVPVILLTDQLLADSNQTLKPFSLEGLAIERNLDISGRDKFLRYDFEGITAGRRVPGQDCSIIMTDSHIHDETGHISESISDTVALNDKFIRREKAIAADALPPQYEGALNPTEVFVCWGSSYGAVFDAVQTLNAQGHAIGVLSFIDVYPLSEDKIRASIPEGARLIGVELNATHQFAKLLRMETGVSIKEHISKYDGRPFTAEDIIKGYKELTHEY